MLYDAIIFLPCLAVALWLAARDSRWLVPFVLTTWAFTPEARRVVDYLTGGYRSITILSVLPLATTLTLILPIWRSPHPLPSTIRNGLFCVGAALLYAAGVGSASSAGAALYEVALFACPLLIIPYTATRSFDERERACWIASLSTIAVLVAAYGWYQFVAAPPWDMLWLRESGMIGSSGDAIAGQFRVFSTLNSAGPLAVFLAVPLVLAIGGRTCRGPLGLLGTATIGSCLILSQVRLGWVLAATGLIAYLAVARGRRRTGAIAVLLIVGALVAVALPLLPGAAKIWARAGTFADLRQDGSLTGRFLMSSAALDDVAANPFGRGMGGTGVGGKLASQAGGSGGFDNGYVDLLLNFGPPVAVLLLLGIAMLVHTAARARSSEVHARFAWLAIAIAASYAVGLLAYNLLSAVMGMMLWTSLACALHPAIEAHVPSKRTTRRRKRRRTPIVSVAATAEGQGA